MALFSRRKKTSDDPSESQTSIQADAPDELPEDVHPAEPVPQIGISVQAFRGVGAAAGPKVALDDSAEPSAAPAAAASAPQHDTPASPVEEPKRELPLAPLLPPEPTESMPGMKDNVLLRTALAELGELAAKGDGATNEQLVGVLRQMMQNHLYLRVHGDARAQLAEGKPLSIAVVRDGERSFMLAFSSAAALRESVQRETDPTATSAVAQPVTAVLHQLVAGDFAGLIVDNASGPRRAVFPLEVLKHALEQADVNMTVKTLLAAPREQDTVQKVTDALAKTKMWVAVNNNGGGEGEIGIAEARAADGRRFLQLFSHPLEIVALGRGDRPLPFEPAQLAKVLSSHSALDGVIIDSAGPSLAIMRSTLAPVLASAAEASAAEASAADASAADASE